MQGKAADIIRHLGLQPHPEGGHYREMFRDPSLLTDGRPASTAIFFLLEQGETSRWHRVTDAAEIWHWYAGAPLLLSMAGSNLMAASITLGGDIFAGQTPQAVVEAAAWQQARSLGDWSLVGCTVAPGFEFSSFEIASPALVARIRPALSA